VSAEKKSNPNPVKPTRQGAMVHQEIRLRPSLSDYATFARTTAIAMGKTATNVSTRKPDNYLLSLLNLGS
jgi:hypothetical protein